MLEQRHPHPHVDPRQPRNDSRPGTNPPVFVWKPAGPGDEPFRLVVARDEALADVTIDTGDLADPMHLPTTAFPPGRYYWRWSCAAGVSETFTFEITPDAVTLEVPPAAEWLRGFPDGHPRIFIRPEGVPALRDSRESDRAAMWKRLRAEADALIDASHEIEEPPYLADRKTDYEGFFRVWHRVLVESRRFVREARTLALAHLASGDPTCARCACDRMASISRWDPMGSSHIDHNDEAHMSVIWDGPQVCDWVWDQFTDDERERVVEQFRRRGEINFEHMHDRGMYGVQRFDSHAGREIVFLAQIAFVFHEHIPDAARWLEWLRPVLCGVWPIWAGDDGGWAQGPSYSTAYVGIQTMFATSLKVGAGVDMYRRPFWANHARWRQWCVPPYADWLGFGDNGYPADALVARNAGLVEIIERQTHSEALTGYIAACRDAAGEGAIDPQTYIADTCGTGVSPVPSARTAEIPMPVGMPHEMLRTFPYAGLASIRTDLDGAPDLAFLFRSSPLGSISHSHANNNDFALFVAGEPVLIPSGYYCGYGSKHHCHWLWHTKAHNCVTLSDAGQLQRSFESTGAVEAEFEDDRVAFFRGNADAGYALTDRCRRHVIFLKRSACFLLIDEFAPSEGASAALQWNVHSFEPFEVDESARRFATRRGDAEVTGHVLHHAEGFFTIGEGFDPPPMARDDRRTPNQHHLRYSVAALGSINLGVVLAAERPSRPAVEVTAEYANGTEIARIAGDTIYINPGRGIDCEGVRSDAVAVLLLDDTRYEVTDDGLKRP